MPSQIIFNGKTYASPDEMPPDVRQAYEQVMGVLADHNQDGTPDILEDGLLKGMGKLLADENKDGVPDVFENVQPSAVMHTATFVVDGKTYHSLDEIPPEARQRYEAAMSKMNADRANIPEWLNSLQAKPTAPAVPPPVIETESSDGRLALAGCVIVVLVLVAAAMAYILWMQ